MTGQPLSAAEVTKVTGGRASRGVNGNRKDHEVEAGQIRGTPFALIVSTSQRVDARQQQQAQESSQTGIVSAGFVYKVQT